MIKACLINGILEIGGPLFNQTTEEWEGTEGYFVTEEKLRELVQAVMDESFAVENTPFTGFDFDQWLVSELSK